MGQTMIAIHGSEKVDHFIYKCLVLRAAAHIMRDYPGSWEAGVSMENKLGRVSLGEENALTPDVSICWYNKSDRWSVPKNTYVEVQRIMKEKEFLRKIAYYREKGLDYEIIDINKLPHTYEEDFELIKDIIEPHVPRKAKPKRGK